MPGKTCHPYHLIMQVSQPPHGCGSAHSTILLRGPPIQRNRLVRTQDSSLDGLTLWCIIMQCSSTLEEK